jgi:hypothetical protein
MSVLVVRISLAVLAAGSLAACSSMPTWTKPSTWYDGVTAPDEAKTTEAKPEAKPVQPAAATQVSNSASPVIDPLEPEPERPRITPSEKPAEFPNLASQPAAREATTSESQRREIRDSLAADRDNAQYTADELRGGAQPAAAPPAPAAAPPAPAVAKPASKASSEKPADEKPAEEKAPE